ncbi:hypothetical protein ARMGADRAFT_1020521 [Armillaria gallica]|uniref:Uncharacterized protein n=1 Tax=Armillaria gallica TaxID=47427 RepID=A0A2H3CDE9_ARMGA|nr:hypothetical protein ARMGADRAFT_1020521 [Armillaria gallica]
MTRVRAGRKLLQKTQFTTPSSCQKHHKITELELPPPPPRDFNGTNSNHGER